MQKLTGIVTGNAEIRLRGSRPERMLNLLSQNDILFIVLKKHNDDEISIRILRKNLSDAEALSRQAGIEITVVSKSGLPYFALRFKKRYLLLTMPVISILAAFYLSFFIWEIDVVGNKNISPGEILTALENAGVGIGTYGIGLDQEMIRGHVIGEIEALSFITVNVYGSRAEVLVRERVKKPEIVDEKMPSEVKSNKTGLVTDINVFAGLALVKEGDTVLAGETLISGKLDSIGSGTRYVHAMGEIYARTWYELSASMPLEYLTKSYTGEQFHKNAAIIGNFRLNLYLNAGNLPSECDKITSVERLSIAGFELPVSFEQSVYRKYEPLKFELSEDEAEKILKQRLLYSLDKLISDAELTQTTFETAVSNSIITVSLSAECLEQIGFVTPINNLT